MCSENSGLAMCAAITSLAGTKSLWALFGEERASWTGVRNPFPTNRRTSQVRNRGRNENHRCHPQREALARCIDFLEEHTVSLDRATSIPRVRPSRHRTHDRQHPNQGRHCSSCRCRPFKQEQQNRRRGTSKATDHDTDRDPRQDADQCVKCTRVEVQTRSVRRHQNQSSIHRGTYGQRCAHSCNAKSGIIGPNLARRNPSLLRRRHISATCPE